MSYETLKTRLNGCQLPAWEMIPDLGLYMDQILTYTERILPEFGTLTASMVNNYVKSGLVDRPVGKKYNRAAIAQLLMICALKATITQDQINDLLHKTNESSTEKTYQIFRQRQEDALKKIEETQDWTPLSCAMESACLAYFFRMMVSEQSSQGASESPTVSS